MNEEFFLRNCDIAICRDNSYSYKLVAVHIPFDDCIIVHVSDVNFSAFLMITALHDEVCVHRINCTTLVRYNVSS
jgi:hypothetical protein